MTREEIIREKIFNIIKYNIELDDYGNHIYYNTICDELLALIKQDEKKVAKEFVAWYKRHLEQIQEHEKKLLDDVVELGCSPEYRKGTTDMLDRVLSYIDDKLAEFLKEKDNERN